MILTLEGTSDTTTLFFRTHELKYRGFHLYFSPGMWFSNFYGFYNSIYRDWHSQYLVVTSLDGSPWKIANISLYRVPATEKLSHKLHKLTGWQNSLLHDLLKDYDKSHIMMKPPNRE